MAKNKKEQQQEQNKERPAEEAAEPKAGGCPESKGSKIKSKERGWRKRKLKAERDEYLSLLQRERADFENYKRRNQAAISEAYQNAAIDVATKFFAADG